ncbi:MAG: hypothetical protein OQL19_07810 [Gammaproteobacteria bacterium]|nr:hypothetical protein [Gammaproteobacteria bacterium]
MKAYKIGVKLLGLFFIFSGISMLPSMLIMAVSSPGGELGIISFISLAMPLFTFLAGLFVFIKTDFIVSSSKLDFKSDEITDDNNFNFSSAIQLLGLFFFISHFADAISDVFTIVAYNPNDEKTLFDTKFYLNSLVAFIGLTLVFKGKSLAKHINETTE